MITNEKYLNLLKGISNTRTVVNQKIHNRGADYKSILKIVETGVYRTNSQIQPAPNTIKNKTFTNFQILCREINMKLKLLQKSLPSFSCKLISRKFLEEAKKSKDYVVTLNPCGTHSILYASDNLVQIVCDNEYIITTNLYLPSPDNENLLDNSIFEGYFIDKDEIGQDTFVICDALMFNGQDLRSEPLDIRIGFINQYVFGERAKAINKLAGETIRIMLRPYFPLNNLSTILPRLDQVVTYPVYSILIGPITSSWCQDQNTTEWVYWNRYLPRPIISLSVNFTLNELYGLISIHGGLVKAMTLGSLSKDLTQLDGQLVQIEFDTTNKRWNLLNFVTDQQVWTYDQFSKDFATDELPISMEDLQRISYSFR